MLKRLAVPLVCALFLEACGPDPLEQFARARTAYAAHDYGAARIDLMAALKERPDDPEILELMARTQLRMDDGEGALATLQRLQAVGKMPGDGAILLGDAAILRGQFQEAAAHVRGMDSAEAARIRGLAFVGEDRFEDAESAFAQGLGGSGPRSALQAVYARYHLDSGRPLEARQLAAQALKDNPAELVALRVMGGAAAMEGRNAEALAAANRLLERYPDDLPGLFGKISALGELGRIDQIEPVVEKVQQLAPGHPRVAFFKAMLASERKDWAEVRRIVQPMERNLDTQPELQLLYAKSLLQLGQVEQARAYLSPLLLQSPTNREIRMLLAIAQRTGGDTLSAVETLRPFAGDPGAGWAELALLARAAREARDPQEGVYAAMALAAKGRVAVDSSPSR